MTGAPFAVAVVMPVRNGAAFLGAALASVLAQRLPPTEIVVVDDGSSDGSGSLAGSISPTVRVITQPPTGRGAARNRGVEATRAPWIGFLDADDLWTPDKLVQQRRALAGNPEANLVLGLVRQFFDPSLGRHDRPKPLVLEGTLPSAILIRRDLFLETGGFPTDPASAEFAEWWLTVQELHPTVARVATVVAERRIHGQNQGVADPGAKAAYVRMIKALLDRRRGREPRA